MKFNKLIAIFPLFLVLLASCGGSPAVPPDPDPDPEPAKATILYYADCQDTSTPYLKLEEEAGKHLTKPTDPTSNDPAFDVFVGWSRKPIIGSTDELWNFETDVVLDANVYQIQILYGQWDSSYIEPVDPIETETWYIVGEGSFLTVPSGSTWSIATGIAMVKNTEYSGDGVEYKAIDQAFETGDVWKLCNDQTPQSWISSGWETDAGALKSGSMALISDGYGGNNVTVVTSGTYDIYFKVYSDNSYSCYIGE